MRRDITLWCFLPLSSVVKPSSHQSPPFIKCDLAHKVTLLTTVASQITAVVCVLLITGDNCVPVSHSRRWLTDEEKARDVVDTVDSSFHMVCEGKAGRLPDQRRCLE